MRDEPKKYESLEEAIPRDIFKSEVNSWAKCIGVEPKQIYVRPMKNKWGSCSTKGIVSFDEKLLQQHSKFRKRVIIEELLHLKVPNHGKLFKSLLKAYSSL